jgi:hypothetical protein
MDYVYYVALVMSIIMLIVFLVVFGSIMANKPYNQPFPLEANNCPDSWPEIDGVCVYIPEGIDEEIKKWKKNNSSTYISEYDKFKPIMDRIDNIGKNNGSIKNLTDLKNSQVQLDSNTNLWDWGTTQIGLDFNEMATICDKKKWANFNGIHWDGISNYNNC